MLNQYGTHADALGLLLRLRGNSNQFTSERSGGIARGAHVVIVSIVTQASVLLAVIIIDLIRFSRIFLDAFLRDPKAYFGNSPSTLHNTSVVIGPVSLLPASVVDS